jgi:quercetin dioxygenase-like cupin family protein
MLRILRVLCLAPLLLSAAEPTRSTVLLRTSTTWNGAPIHYSGAARPEVQALRVEIAPGGSTVWHKHPVNNFAYILEGDLRLELEDGTTRVFHAGDAFAEVVDTWHKGTNIGPGTLKILVFYAGAAGVPVAIPRP